MWPQIILLLLFMLGLGVSLANHGKPRGNENVWITLISDVIVLSILWWGGFFNPLFGK